MSPMLKTVVIDYLPESARRYRSGWVIVAVDVIRATTTAITAAAGGWRCFPAPSVEVALELSRELSNPILAGETSGTMPSVFEMDNSPAQLAARSDRHRPLVLVSSSGTKVIDESSACEAVYLSCFRNYSSLACYLAGRHARIAIIGAGSKGEFREEDQMCCAWIAARLLRRGYSAGSPQTLEIVSQWRDARPEACLGSRSIDFLRRTGQLRDLDFILSHVDDLYSIFAIEGREVRIVSAAPRLFGPRSRSVHAKASAISSLWRADT